MSIEQHIKDVLAADNKKIEERIAADNAAVLAHWGMTPATPKQEEKPADLQEDCACKTSVTGDTKQVDTDEPSQAEKDAAAEEKEEKAEAKAEKEEEPAEEKAPEDDEEKLNEAKEKKFKRPTSGPNWKSAGAPIDRDEYPEIKGLEGPFKFKAGILYYDPKEGKYYNSKTDMYLEELPESCEEISEEELDAIVTQLKEVSPPDADIKKWAEEPKVKAAFRKRYGDKWKQVMYGRAWNMFNKQDGE